MKDSWEATITTDSSGGGSFVNYPETFTYLMSAKRREEVISGFSKIALDRMVLPGINRKLDVYELAMMTRSAHSRIYKSGTVCYKGKISHFLPSYKEEGTEEIKEVIYRKFVGDVNVGRKGVRI